MRARKKRKKKYIYVILYEMKKNVVWDIIYFVWIVDRACKVCVCVHQLQLQHFVVQNPKCERASIVCFVFLFVLLFAFWISCINFFPHCSFFSLCRTPIHSPFGAALSLSLSLSVSTRGSHSWYFHFVDRVIDACRSLYRCDFGGVSRFFCFSSVQLSVCC